MILIQLVFNVLSSVNPYRSNINMDHTCKGIFHRAPAPGRSQLLFLVNVIFRIKWRNTSVYRLSFKWNVNNENRVNPSHRVGTRFIIGFLFYCHCVVSDKIASPSF